MWISDLSIAKIFKNVKPSVINPPYIKLYLCFNREVFLSVLSIFSY